MGCVDGGVSVEGVVVKVLWQGKEVKREKCRLHVMLVEVY